MSLVETRNLWVSYGKALILQDVSMHVDSGELVAVIGPNGAGKTTLLRAISKMVQPQGAVFFQGNRIDHLSPVGVVKLGIIHCPEGRQLFYDLTVTENLELGAYLRSIREEVKRDMEEMFDIFPILRTRGNQLAKTLSGGEQQMLAIARSLMSQPKFLMLDEPSIGLAVIVKRLIATTIKEIQKRGTTILLVEQDANLAFEVADRIYVLEHGKMAMEDRPDNMIRNPYVKEIYLGLA